jgi:hypothetical protein
MPSVETRPYLSCAQDTVTFDPWIREQGGLPEVLPTHLVDWDPMQDVVIKRTFTVHIDRLKSDCHLGSDAKIALAISWRSLGSGQRGIAHRQLLDGTGDETSHSIEAKLPGRELAGAVRIISRILLDQPGSADGLLAAKRPGAILWEEQVQLVLEGIGSRFPMEVVDFSTIGLPPSSAWRLHWNRGSLNAQAMGCLCLLLNKQHRRVAVAASRTTPDAEARAIWSAINLGVAREIITGVLTDDSFISGSSRFDDGSVGNVALALINRAFPGEAPQAVLERLKNSPDRFECELQAAFQLFDPGN